MPPLDDRSPVILSFNTVPDFLEYLLQESGTPTTLLVCSTRDDFLAQVDRSVRQHGDSPSVCPDDGSQCLSLNARHHLIHPTIQLISASRSMRLVFCPTVQHLRAYLSTYTSPPDISSRTSTSGSSASLLGLINVISAHRSTSDFAAQGISRTLAVAVEAAARTGQKLVLTEFEERGAEMVEDHSIWDEAIPLLCGTVRSYGGVDDGGWAGRTVSVARVVRRWFTFEGRLDREMIED